MLSCVLYSAIALPILGLKIVEEIYLQKKTNYVLLIIHDKDLRMRIHCGHVRMLVTNL